MANEQSNFTAPNMDFLLTPYQMNSIVDYRTSEGRKFYDKATSSVSNVPFDGSTDNLLTFLDDVTRRANEFGWDDEGVGIFEVPDDTTSTGYKSLLKNYGEFTLENIRNHEKTYITGVNRAAQDTVMLHNALMNSLSPEGKAKVIVWRNSYIINNIPSGLALFKVIIRESHIDSQATAASIRIKLSNLDTYIPTIGHDIGQFNRYVKRQIQALRARGEMTHDLLTNLFKAYLAIPDKTFSNYISKKKDEYDEGAEITADNLMIWAKTKYDIIKEEGKCNSPTDEEQKIIALQTQISKIEKRKSNATTKFSIRHNSKGMSHTNSYKPFTPKPEWFKYEPKIDKFKPRTWYGRQWYWCGFSTGGQCNCWRQHQPSTCWKNNSNTTNYNKNTVKSSHTVRKPEKSPLVKKEKPDRKRLKLNKALSAIVSNQSDESNSN